MNLSSTSALLVFASAEISRPAAAALRIAADGVDLTARGAAVSTVLYRATLAITAVALSHSDPGALASLVGIDVTNEPLLASDALRYGRLHDGDAQITYDAAVTWLLSRPWRTEIAALASDEGLAVGIAEVDLLMACLAARTGHGPHSGGLSAQTIEAPRRLAARLRDPRQESGLAALLGTSTDEIRAVLTETYSGVTAVRRDGFPNSPAEALSGQLISMHRPVSKASAGIRVVADQRYRDPMADFALLLDAPDRAWAEHVQTLIQTALGIRGSVSLGLPGERLPDSVAAPACVITGIAVCDEPSDEMLAVITGPLVDYDVTTSVLDCGATQIAVRPPPF